MKFSRCLFICLILLSAVSIFAQSETEKGVELYRNGDFDGAIVSLKKAAAENYRDVFAFHYLGLAQERKNSLYEAIESHKQVIAVCIDLIERNMSLITDEVSEKKGNFKDFVNKSLEKEIEMALQSSERLEKLSSSSTLLKNWQMQILILNFFSKKTDLFNEKAINSTPLKVLTRPQPTYAQRAITNRTSGVVNLYILFLSNGEVGIIIPKNWLPDGLTENAVKAAKEIKFEPATQNNKPISIIKSVQYVFTP